jgi:hypothetical protein
MSLRKTTSPVQSKTQVFNKSFLISLYYNQVGFLKRKRQEIYLKFRTDTYCTAIYFGPFYLRCYVNQNYLLLNVCTSCPAVKNTRQ